jgi:hypothetical protein
MQSIKSWVGEGTELRKERDEENPFPGFPSMLSVRSSPKVTLAVTSRRTKKRDEKGKTTRIASASNAKFEIVTTTKGGKTDSKAIRV